MEKFSWLIPSELKARKMLWAFVSGGKLFRVSECFFYYCDNFSFWFPPEESYSFKAVFKGLFFITFYWETWYSLFNLHLQFFIAYVVKVSVDSIIVCSSVISEGLIVYLLLKQPHIFSTIGGSVILSVGSPVLLYRF